MKMFSLNKFYLVAIFLFSFSIKSFSQNFDLTTENGNTYNSGSYTCGTSTISDVFSSTGDYTMTICPAAGEVAYFNITSVTLNNNGGTNSDDILYVYDGTGTGGTILHQDGPNSTGSPVVVTGSAPGACITIRFLCEDSSPNPSFSATIGCLPAPNAGGDQATGDCSTSVTLAGNSVAPATGTWTVSPAGPTITSPNSPTSTATGMTAGTAYTYTWTSNDGTASFSDDMTFNSEGPGCWDYCDVSWGSATTGHISNVSIPGNANSISQSSGWTPYTDYTGSCVELIVGTSTTLTVDMTSSAYTLHTFYYIDWNNDGDFLDAGEAVDMGETTGGGQLTGTITIPGGQADGDYEIRIVTSYSTNPTSGCYDNTFGETEDYCFTVISGHCYNNVKDADEDQIDCGGVDCEPCGTCLDGIQNGEETGPDCGGSVCAPCGNLCTDGIQNGDETGVDCGGAFCPSCTQPGPITGTSGCTTASQADIYPYVCEHIGTSAYGLYNPVAEVVTSASPTEPYNAATIGCSSAVGDDGGWLHVSLEPGVEQYQWQFDAFNGAPPGNTAGYVAAYQTAPGATCPTAGSYIGCLPTFNVSGSGIAIYNVTFSNLDDTKDLWLYYYASNAFSIDYGQIAAGAPPANDECATATAASGGACNLGATGATFTTPAVGGYPCDGGNWGSNENTTFYEVNVSDVTATLDITDINCNDGAGGVAQFGVWASCGDVGTYTSPGFLGCAVGNTPLTLSGLDPANTYIIATDGNAGSNCTWEFSGTNILLPVELSQFNARVKDDIVELEWITLSQTNNDYFTIEKSIDGENYEVVKVVDGEGNSTSFKGYTDYDTKPYKGISYYRLKQTDFDGKYTYSNIESVKIETSFDLLALYPNPVQGESYLSFNTNTRSNVLLEIHDISGKIVLSNTYTSEKGENRFIIATGNLTKGMYFLTLSDDFNKKNLKFIKE
ncbi:T9SS type A sorting domain-containing protein [Vicingus serpentipes]|uniref:T9SS type A sorting domain-containing protein n=1 Tax=Vicingus serpentipes TaxID=1926625 RepID=A0A5C6RXR1_9FLAO|nr:T9SS type A sorting domain-containing protein [Vicingus serpentipes]TXB66795.1 T9SS type A sorting domain-containing protein [Vicingus serpentipes]